MTATQIEVVSQMDGSATLATMRASQTITLMEMAGYSLSMSQLISLPIPKKPIILSMKFVRRPNAESDVSNTLFSMVVLALLFLAGSGASTEEPIPTSPTFISRFRNSVKRMARSLISRC